LKKQQLKNQLKR